MARRKVREREESWPTEPRDFGDEPTANVGMGLSRTVGLGDFESVRCEVSLHVPCLLHEVDDTVERVDAWVQRRLSGWVRKVHDEFDR